MMRTALTVPGDGRVSRLVRGYVRELSRLAELDDDATDSLVLAVDEACTNVMAHAFPPGDEPTVTVRGEVAAGTLAIVVRDRGVPTGSASDPSSTDPSFAPSSSDEPHLRGLGLRLMKRAVDEVRWSYLGREGNELSLVKHRSGSTSSITTLAPALPPTHAEASSALAPAQTYDVRALRSDEALAVTRCIFRAYGLTYANDALYDPKRIVEMNADRELVSVVALTEAGEIVGHCALERIGGARVAELGVAAVDPAHRARGLLQRMAVWLEDEAKRIELALLVAQPVTSHPFSQRLVAGLGYVVCGLVLGKIPEPSGKSGGLHKAPRESMLLTMRSLMARDARPIHVPERHAALAERIYASLGQPVHLRTREELPGSEPGALEMGFHPRTRAGAIRILRIGSDTQIELQRAVSDLQEIARAEVTTIEIPLSSPSAPWAVAEAESLGFSFAYIALEAIAGEDAIGLARYDGEIDPARMSFATDAAAAMLRYVLDDRARVRGR
jgi:anti-sigma regulatory factor (Ser/Thr protein kinase)/GNAT superfamily N-acetyltransferase